MLRGHVWTVPVSMRVKFEVVSLTVLVLLAFNAQNLGGYMTLATPPFGKNSRSHVRTVPANMTHTPTVHQRHRQTDGQTDRRTTYDSEVKPLTAALSRYKFQSAAP